jgi:hypothetical protein
MRPARSESITAHSHVSRWIVGKERSLLNSVPHQNFEHEHEDEHEQILAKFRDPEPQQYKRRKRSDGKPESKASLCKEPELVLVLNTRRSRIFTDHQFEAFLLFPPLSCNERRLADIFHWLARPLDRPHNRVVIRCYNGLENRRSSLRFFVLFTTSIATSKSAC